MLRFAADENFNGKILRGLLRVSPTLDIVRLQDVGMSGADDPSVLAWCAEETRILLTHDVSTITRFAYERIENSRAMPGVFEVADDLAIGETIEQIVLIVECSVDEEWNNQIVYLPLR